MKPDNSAPKSRYNIEALARGLDILSLFSAERPVLTLSQIVELLDLNKSTAYRVLATLESGDYLVQDPVTRQYRPGLKVLQLGFTAINTLEIRHIARPYLERLSQEVGETVSLAVLDGFRTIYVDRIRNQSIVGVVLGVGSSLPAHCTALGKVLLADLPPGDLERLLAANAMATYTPKTLTTKESLLAALGEVRRLGYALDDEELASGLRAVAAPIRDFSGRTIAAANVSGTSLQITDERIEGEIIPALVHATRQISSILGYLPS
jgi:IclR family pca regulon transcriptional regulator